MLKVSSREGRRRRRRQTYVGPTSDLRVANFGVPGLFADPPLDGNVKERGKGIICAKRRGFGPSSGSRTLRSYSLPNKGREEGSARGRRISPPLWPFGSTAVNERKEGRE